jgi:hypothetical protein
MPKPMARIPVRLNDSEISRLAREIARDIKPINEILEVFRLSADEFDKISETKFFQVRLAEEIQLWNASDPLSVAKRIETKAATMVEDCLLEVYALIHDPNQPMQAKVEALKWAARMAGMGENSAKADSSGGVKITINVGGKALEFEKEKLPRDVTKATDVVDLTPGVS